MFVAEPGGQMYWYRSVAAGSGPGKSRAGALPKSRHPWPSLWRHGSFTIVPMCDGQNIVSLPTDRHAGLSIEQGPEQLRNLHDLHGSLSHSASGWAVGAEFDTQGDGKWIHLPI